MDNWSRGRYGRIEIVPAARQFFTFSFFVWCLLVLLALVGGPVLFFDRGSSARLAVDHGAAENCGRRRQIVAGVLVAIHYERRYAIYDGLCLPTKYSRSTSIPTPVTFQTKLLGLVGGPVLFFGVAPATKWAAGRVAVEKHGLRRQLAAGFAFVAGVMVAAGVFWARGRRRLVHIDEEGVWWVAPVLRARLRALMLLLSVELGVLGFGP
ncbi:hypothetical protein HDK77DRAFT_432404 [Phyllosticta capitalensis]